MMFPDFVDLLREFSAAGVEFLVVGAHALSVYGHIRATKDLNVWVRPDRENGLRMLTALAEFGAPLDGLDADDVAGGDVVFQIGVPPEWRTDWHSALPGPSRRLFCARACLRLPEASLALGDFVAGSQDRPRRVVAFWVAICSVATVSSGAIVKAVRGACLDLGARHTLEMR